MTNLTLGIYQAIKRKENLSTKGHLRHLFKHRGNSTREYGKNLHILSECLSILLIQELLKSLEARQKNSPVVEQVGDIFLRVVKFCYVLW